MKAIVCAASIAAMGSVCLGEMTVSSVFRSAEIIMNAGGLPEAIIDRSNLLVDTFGGANTLFADNPVYGMGQVTNNYMSSYSGTRFDSYARTDISLSAIEGVNGSLLAIGLYQDEITFSIDQEEVFQLDALFENTEGIITNSSIRLTGSSTEIYSASVSSGQLLIDEQFLLGPGSYKISVYHIVDVTAPAYSTNSGFFEGTVSFQQIPTPSSLAFLTLSALLTTRRRR